MGNNRVLLLAGVIGLLFIAVACAQPEQDVDSADDADLRDQEFYDSLEPSQLVLQIFVDGFCKAAWECYDHPEISRFTVPEFGRFSSLEECKTEAHPFVRASITELELKNALEGGRLDVDSAGAIACQNRIREMMCDDGVPFFLAVPEGCADVISGRMTVDQACVNSYECEPTLSCERYNPDPCYGFCVPPDEGEPGAEFQDCGGQICSDDEYCHRDWSGADNHSCEPQISEGKSCEVFDSCEDGLYCLDGVCDKFVVGTLGDDCSEDHPFCEPGTFCSGGNCIALGEKNAPCSNDQECTYQYLCGETGLCEPLRELDEACIEDTHCTSGACQREPGQPGKCVSAEEEYCVHPDD